MTNDKSTRVQPLSTICHLPSAITATPNEY